jgi:hypothetical protein
VEETDANENLTLSIYDVAAARDADIEAMKRHADQMAHNTMVAQNLGQIIGEAFGEAVSGQKSFGDAMKAMLPQILKMLLAEAMASMITAGAKQSAKTGNPILGVAAAAAGTAAISALFNKAVSSGSSTGRAAQASNGSSFNGERTASSVGGGSAQDNKVIAETLIRGQDLYVIFKNYERGRKYTNATNG